MIAELEKFNKELEELNRYIEEWNQRIYDHDMKMYQIYKRNQKRNNKIQTIKQNLSRNAPILSERGQKSILI